MDHGFEWWVRLDCLVESTFSGDVVDVSEVKFGPRMRFFDLLGFGLGSNGRHDGMAEKVMLARSHGLQGGILGSPSLKQKFEDVCGNEATATCRLSAWIHPIGNTRVRYGVLAYL